MTAASLPSIAILIASMNRAAMLRECLASCGSQSEPPDRLAVIDGGSTDGTREVHCVTWSAAGVHQRLPRRIAVKAINTHVF